MTKASKKRDRAGGDNPSTRGPSTGGRGRDAPKRDERRRDSGTGRKGIAGVPGSKNPERRCTATVFSTGLRCKRAAIKGGTVCTSHGGAAPQVKRSAKERLLELADPAIAALSKIVRNEDTDDAVRLRAALGIVDRLGMGPGMHVEISTTWNDALSSAFEMQAGVDRSSLAGSGDRELPTSVGGGDDPLGFEDAEQHGRDEQTRQWAAYDTEDEEPYTTRLDPYDGNTVRGEVIDSEILPNPMNAPKPPSDYGGDNRRSPVPDPLDPPRYRDAEAREADQGGG